MSDKIGFEELRSLFKDLLSKAFGSKNVDTLEKTFIRIDCNESDKKAAMDQAFRDKLLELLVKHPETLESFVDFCIESCRKQMVTPTMPVVLLGDIFDALTLDKCEKMFSYVEKGVHIWKAELFFVACKNNLLRMCNDLLRRLSRSQNTVFCGRILLFLAKFFPFSERSGLNIVSEFNLENVTEFGSDKTGNLKESLEDEVVIGADKNKLTIDYNLYCKFWALQDFFRNPNSCYNKLQWKTFVAHSGSVLSAFSSYKLEAVQLQKSKLNRLRPVSNDVEMQEGDKETHYFAKFLTNQKLLELQLSDSNFRRCVLVQFLILFQYLNSTVKFKLDSQELKPEQSDWVKETSSLIYKLLGETPPEGERFASCVRRILRREEHWNHWKNDGCPEFQKPKLPLAEGADELRKISRKRKRPLGDIVKEYDSNGKFYLGNNELTKLWNLCPDNLAACRTKDRDFMPSLESYLVGDGEGEVRRRTGDGAWGWRALRLLARRSPHFFTHTNNPIAKLPVYLDDMVNKVARELRNTAAASAAVDNGSQPDKDKSIVKQEAGDEENSEEQMEADLMQAADATDIETQTQDPTRLNEDFSEGLEKSRSRVTMISPEQLDAVSSKLTDWKKLASKLGYKNDEIQYFESENACDDARAKNMLQLWFDDDEDASVENLLYIMEGLELIEACEALKSLDK